jgi:hypothetical protein
LIDHYRPLINSAFEEDFTGLGPKDTLTLPRTSIVTVLLPPNGRRPDIRSTTRRLESSLDEREGFELGPSPTRIFSRNGLVEIGAEHHDAVVAADNRIRILRALQKQRL